jgi:hypothetical protein
MDQTPPSTPRKRAPGAGRKPKFSTPAVTWTVSGSEEQKAKFYRLGGSGWMQRRIDAAKEPPPK